MHMFLRSIRRNNIIVAIIIINVGTRFVIAWALDVQQVVTGERERSIHKKYPRHV